MARDYTVLKLGGELLESPEDLEASAAHVSAAACDGPLVVVHGGGRELSAELARRGATPHMVDGLRVTDDQALAAAIAVLAGTVNTRLVTALHAAGIRAVGLTGADSGVLLAQRSPKHRTRTGQLVDLGHVGVPVSGSDTRLLHTLCREGWVPVIASIGVTAEGDLLNVNADLAAAHVAIILRARRLLVFGGTDGVLDEGGHVIRELSHERARRLIAIGAASDGMAAKLAACIQAGAAGVAEVRIVCGRPAATVRVQGGGTHVVPSAIERTA